VAVATAVVGHRVRSLYIPRPMPEALIAGTVAR
jgi:hypothetical protein